MTNSKSIDDLQTNLPEFRFDISLTSIDIFCQICVKNDAGLSCNTAGCFRYPIPENYNCSVSDSTGRPFWNLKKSIRRHLMTSTHKDALNDATVKTEDASKIDTREKMVGMRLARIAYNLLKKGRPDTDFPDELLLQHLNGIDVGHINHTENFVRNFLPHIANEVKERLIFFLTSRMPQTGCVPIGKIVADKATSKHRTRHFICFITCMPDADDLIQVIFLEIDIVTGHTGKTLSV